MSPVSDRTVALITLGCARNEVDSEELAARLDSGGWSVVPADGESTPDVVMVNTCGFIDSAKKDSIDTVLAASDSSTRVVAVGCLAQRYGRELAEALPEADAVLGFDSYANIAERLDDVLAGRPITSHEPHDRRVLLPITPTARPAAVAEVPIPGHAWLPGARRRLDDAPTAYVKLASGCDRRCTFCAIPSFRGSFVSRPPQEILAETAWLASTGVREIVLVSENSTSYGKDFGDLRALEGLLPQLAGVSGIERVRVNYLQPAEMRDSLIEVIAGTPGVAPYFDLSFQHASPTVLRRMKRFGSTGAFLDLLERIRSIAPQAGARSNVIVGFPGETADDLEELSDFLIGAQLDAVGVFGYSDEDGTEAVGFEGKLESLDIFGRVARIAHFADELVAQRAEDRIGESVRVLVEKVGEGPPLSEDDNWTTEVHGRAAHQGPDVDGVTVLVDADRRPMPGLRIGQFVTATVVDSEGADLFAQVSTVSTVDDTLAG